jgi:hypothetical protein
MNSLAWRTCIDGAGRIAPWSNWRASFSTPATPFDQYGEVGARGQLALLLQLAEGGQRFGIGPGVEESGDALLAHGVQCRAGGGQVFFWRQRRQQIHRHVLRGVLQDAGGFAIISACDLARVRIGRAALDAGQLHAFGVEQHGVTEGGTHDDGPRGAQAVQRGVAGGDAVRQHALLEPVHHDQPALRIGVLFLVQAGLDARLELRDCERGVIQAAIEQARAAGLRVHMAIDQARHQHAALQVDHAGAFAGERLRTVVAAHVDYAAGAHGQRLLHTVLRVDCVDVAVAVDRVGGDGRGMDSAGKQQGQHGACSAADGDGHAQPPRIVEVSFPRRRESIDRVKAYSAWIAAGAPSPARE